MRIKTLYFLCLLALAFSACQKNPAKTQADLMVFASKIYTFENEYVVYEAMVIKDGEILELGSELEILEKYQAKDTQRFEGFVFPGLIDAHCHFWGLAQTLLQVDLMGSKSWNEVIESCKVFVEENPEAEWITGRGWDETLWEDSQMPNNALLNEAFPDKPVFIRRVDGHAGIANNKAMELAQISKDAIIEGGEIHLKTGLLIDNAMSLVSDKIPPFNRQQMEKGLIKAGEICNKLGLTTLADAGLDPEQIEMIDSLRNADNIHLRFYTMLSYSRSNLDYARKIGVTKTDYLRVNGFKFYADGALGSSGAKLKQPYCGSDFHTGLQLTSTEELRHAFLFWTVSVFKHIHIA